MKLSAWASPARSTCAGVQSGRGKRERLHNMQCVRCKGSGLTLLQHQSGCASPGTADGRPPSIQQSATQQSAISQPQQSAINTNLPRACSGFGRGVGSAGR